MINELSLFSGISGFSLGGKLAFGDEWRTIAYVEWEDYCQEVIEARIKDGHLDAAPIFSDINRFLSEGYADLYKGVADIITAGFPCQPFSVAGKRKGTGDERNLWPQTYAAICKIRPRWVLLENVPGLLTFDYIRRIFGDLAEAGYDTEWHCVSAASVGARHKRERLWIMAYTNGKHGDVGRLRTSEMGGKRPEEAHL